MKRGKSQIGINKANKPSEFICSISTWKSYLPVGICYCFKAEKQRKSQRGNAAAAIELDCKTVRIFAYSSTHEQSNKRSGTRLKTESETG